MYEEPHSNYKKVLAYLLATLLIFALLSWLSYHNGMAYDGLTTIGFPLTYYTVKVQDKVCLQVKCSISVTIP